MPLHNSRYNQAMIRHLLLGGLIGGLGASLAMLGIAAGYWLVLEHQPRLGCAALLVSSVFGFVLVPFALDAVGRLGSPQRLRLLPLERTPPPWS